LEDVGKRKNEVHWCPKSCRGVSWGDEASATKKEKRKWGTQPGGRKKSC